ncbi:hypothetical protein CsatB_008029 [Cannabis sativa]|uniref:Uncharacterized protein n=1 Tax=Cannabis sativa TaxID=3483 RepID=A0A803QVQ7_CANSA
MIILMNLKVLSAFHSLKVFIFGRCNHLNHLSSHTIHVCGWLDLYCFHLGTLIFFLFFPFLIFFSYIYILLREIRKIYIYIY